VVIGKLFDSPNVAIYDNTIIGNNVVIHAGTVLGADAFYYKARCWLRQIAFRRRVVIKIMLILEHCVRSIKELQDTTIGEGTKIDNQVHVGRHYYWKKMFNCFPNRNCGLC
jgi:UDP-3-O-[3-hydroxymyristoyl] glucosamine N-acyltransferase